MKGKRISQGPYLIQQLLLWTRLITASDQSMTQQLLLRFKEVFVPPLQFSLYLSFNTLLRYVSSCSSSHHAKPCIEK